MSGKRKRIKIADLIPDSENARAHSPENIDSIATALREVGAGRSIAGERAGNDHPLFVVVGGGREVEALCQEHGWGYVYETMDQGVGEIGDA